MNQQERPKVSVYIAVSIDGYIAREGGEVDWLNQVHIGNEDYGYALFFASIDVLILGRKTYEFVANLNEWLYQGKRVIVMSRTLQNVCERAELFQGGPLELLQKLSKEGVKHCWVDGGVTITGFLRQGFVDQLIVSVIPTLLGSGIPLFNRVGKEIPCSLIASKSYPSGLVQLQYEVGKQG